MILDVVNKFQKEKRYLLMFSGGVDSSIVLSAGLKAGADITPVWINNGFNRAFESEIRKQAESIGADNLEVINIKSDEEVEKNPLGRCYLCKSEIITTIKNRFGDDVIVIDGTNGSDRSAHRPGGKALKEYSVESYIGEFDKADIIKMASLENINFNIANMESCLATRINYGIEIRKDFIDAIRNVERCIIESTEDYDVRCRLDDSDHIRIELSKPESYIKLSEKNFRDKVILLSNEIAKFVTIDLKRSRPNEYDNRK